MLTIAIGLKVIENSSKLVKGIPQKIGILENITSLIFRDKEKDDGNQKSNHPVLGDQSNRIQNKEQDGQNR